jgi:hypothetical protein
VPELLRPARGADATAATRAEVARLRQGLDRVETALAQLTNSQPSVARARPERYYQLLVDLYEYGRHGAAADTFAQLGRARGYDARGLGGCFAGSRAPLRRRDARVTLTSEGHRLVAEYLHGMAG